jgi:hypothetical protein
MALCDWTNTGMDCPAFVTEQISQFIWLGDKADPLYKKTGCPHDDADGLGRYSVSRLGRQFMYRVLIIP